MQQKNFLGSGIKWPLNVDNSGDLNLTHDEECIRQSIWLILGTSKGERVMRPDFGCGIHDLLFAPNNVQTASRIESEIIHALLKWEPRVEVLNVSASADTNEHNLLNIEIDYRIRDTNSRFNMVYPFYLE